MFLYSRSAQDQVHPGNGRPHVGNDAPSRDGAAQSHHPHLLRHDAVRVPFHAELPDGEDAGAGRGTGAAEGLGKGLTDRRGATGVSMRTDPLTALLSSSGRAVLQRQLSLAFF